MEAAIFAVALWFPANHNAASFVGANITNGCAQAANVWPRRRIGYL